MEVANSKPNSMATQSDKPGKNSGLDQGADLKQLVAGQYNADGARWHSNRGSGHDLLEKPAIFSLLPDLRGKSVLCVGSGYGDECQHLSALGARRVVGIDISSANTANAKERFPGIEFLEMDMEDIKFPPNSFDIILSSLAIHYVPSWEATLRGMCSVLTPGGLIVLSTHHPASWSAEKEENDLVKRQVLGYEVDKSSGKITVFGDYLKERPVTAKFGGKFEASFYHKSFSGMLREFRDAGLSILECTEPSPLPEAKQADPLFWELRSRFPLFILFKLQKGDAENLPATARP